jgi:Uncharacterized protein conserved in bacteria (DUF2188)
MSKNTHHVVPDPKGGWNVKNEGASRASKRFDTQQDAIKYARNKSKAQRSGVVIHNPDGTIRNKRSYEDDPLPPRVSHK